MLEVINARKELERAEEAFRERFRADAVRAESRTIGFQSGSVSAPVYWHPTIGIWGLFRHWPLDAPTRFWNAFGVGDPTRSRDLNITCEINPPLEGVNRRNAGAFVSETDSGETWIMHSGKIGGGRSGISMTLFWQNWPRAMTFEAWDGRPRKMALVSQVGTAEGLQQLASFVHAIAGMKSSLYPNT